MKTQENKAPETVETAPVETEVKQEVKTAVEIEGIKAPVINDNPNEIESFLAGFKQVAEEQPIIETEEKPKRGRKKKGTEEPIKSEFAGTVQSSVISGALFLLLIDIIIPTLVTLINNRVSKHKIKSNDLKLTAQQKSELEPIANEVAKEINLKGNPTSVLIMSLIAIYAGNLMLIKAAK